MDDILKKEIKKTVAEGISEGISETMSAYGIDIKDQKSMQADMVYLRRVRLGSEEISSWSKRAVITTFLTAIFFLIYIGIKEILKR